MCVCVCVCARVCVLVRMCVRVCVCVCVEGRERERFIDLIRERETWYSFVSLYLIYSTVITDLLKRRFFKTIA